MKRGLVLLLLAQVACSKKPVSCERTIADLDLAKGRVVWFGEMHGTSESPKFVGDVVCQAARTQRVQLGLEIASTEQPRIDKFLANGDRKALTDGSWWKQHDGRSSVAMLELIDRVRQLERAGANISIVAYDVPTADERDTAMADFVRAARKPDEVFVGLSGNIHSRRAKWNELTPMVAHLVAAGLAVKTYDVSANGGTFWACMGEGDGEPVCGEHPMSKDPRHGTPWTIGPRRDDAHDGVYYVGKTMASFPARP